jgi:hypothetical protein
MIYTDQSFTFLARNPYDGGAFALVRPLVEASVEGLWQFYCASEETFRRAYAGEDVDPGLPNMMDELDKHLGERVFGGLRTNVKTLHGFTHGGIEQLGRRFDNEGNLHPNYSDQEKRTAIQVASATYVLLSSIFCKEASDSPSIDERSTAIETRYTELYRTAG